jgi:response regulator RpfG family c-di-GMP phosphodiesterase
MSVRRDCRKATGRQRLEVTAFILFALTSDRPYREAWTVERALQYIREQSGKHFDPQVVEMFLRIIDHED